MDPHSSGSDVVPSIRTYALDAERAKSGVRLSTKKTPKEVVGAKKDDLVKIHTADVAPVITQGSNLELDPDHNVSSDKEIDENIEVFEDSIDSPQQAIALDEDINNYLKEGAEEDEKTREFSKSENSKKELPDNSFDVEKIATDTDGHELAIHEATVVKDHKQKGWNFFSALKNSVVSFLKNNSSQKEIAHDTRSTHDPNEQVQLRPAPIFGETENIPDTISETTTANNIRPVPNLPKEALPRPAQKEEEAVSWSYFIEDDTSEQSSPASIKKARPSIAPADPSSANVPIQHATYDEPSFLPKTISQEKTLGMVSSDTPNTYGQQQYTVRTQSKKKIAEKYVPIHSGSTGNAPSTIRTYRNDAIENIQTNKLSRAKIAAAEATRRELRPPTTRSSNRSKTPIISIIFVLFFLLLSGSAGYVWYSERNIQIEDNIVRTTSFIGPVTQSAIAFSTERSELLSILANAVQSTPGGANTIVQLYPVEKRLTVSTPVTTDSFMKVLDPTTRSSFARSLRNDMMFGVHIGEKRSPYFIFKTEQFDVTFAGMLQWEQAMSADLSPLFGQIVRRTFTATDSTAASTQDPFFVDEVIRNVSVRILYNELGEESILYGFPNKDTLIITSTPEAMVTLMEALK